MKRFLNDEVHFTVAAEERLQGIGEVAEFKEADALTGLVLYEYIDIAIVAGVAASDRPKQPEPPNAELLAEIAQRASVDLFGDGDHANILSLNQTV
jgi:hypothetical protein